MGSAEELLQTVRIGDANRVVGTTGMNDQSSRSHSVLQITMEVRDTVSRSLQHSKLYLVDLAGSESVSRTGAEGVTLDEARTINKSLFNLAKVINALTEEGAAAQHIPYRDSKCVAACRCGSAVHFCALLKHNNDNTPPPLPILQINPPSPSLVPSLSLSGLLECCKTRWAATLARPSLSAAPRAAPTSSSRCPRCASASELRK